MSAKPKPKTERQLRRTIARLSWDIQAYRGALGYEIPASHTGLLRDGTKPQCGICHCQFRQDTLTRAHDLGVQLLACIQSLK